MANESTPLIQTVYVRPPRRGYRHHTCRRFCNILCTSILIFGFASFALHFFFIWPMSNHHGHHPHRGKHLSHEDLTAILLDTPSAKKTEEWSYYYTSGAHLASKNYSQAEWTKDKWEGWGIKSSIVTYDIYLNYPVDHSVSLLTKKSGNADSWNVEFRASLEEDVLKDDPTTGLPDSIPTFHGYSASGNATASFVFVNYGTYQDYEDLIEAGVDIKGKIAIAKYGGNFRGLKVQRAQELGMVGVLMYSDPGDDGGITEENGYAAYPDGPARNPSSVQRGSVLYLSTRPGDPTTPGYPSKPGAPRAPADTVPSIPSIPISYADAIPLLRALNGHGPKVSDLNKNWHRNLGLGHKGIDYNIGPTPDHVVVNLDSQQEYVTTPQWDTIGIINGTIPNEVLVVGNHRDSWTLGGAGDPNSGSAVLNEAVRSVSKAVEAGWKPLRTIVFASWDGEEYGLLGSTEWVEEYLPWIKEANVAYINVDVAVSGPHFEASASPLLNKVIHYATNSVLSPNQTVKGQTVGDVWGHKINSLGSGSDYTAFQDFAGVPSVDIGFTADRSAVYHYHSNYDSFHWMEEFGDPGFVYHEALAKVFNLLIAELADLVVIPFTATEYAEALEGYLDQVEAKLKSTEAAEPTTEEEYFALRTAVTSKGVKGSEDAFQASLKKIRHSIGKLHVNAVELDERAAWANRQLEEGLPWWNIVGKFKLWLAIAKVNKQYKFFERYFTFEGGLDGRSWYKHVVFAPGIWTGYAGAVFPGLVESIDAKDYTNGLKWTGIIDHCITNAIKSIE
ncbi:putative glutamate carboxypeptidase [Cladobotryum mycophilum]|uniref:Glutamate carboxypeptidase n=1 Tax=Cladobotryum mycophilum TaxID=491253 RepID=A0ABR0SKQ4_9HYPO